MIPQGLNTAALQSMTAGMSTLKQVAESGGFAISESGANAYINALKKALGELDDLTPQLDVVAQQTKLGTSPDAVRMSEYNTENVTGGPGAIGLIPAIRELQKVLGEALEAVEMAKANYQNVDGAHSDKFDSN